tara:strand:+ start:200 stop:724 length:525 start_codon:yes stop_codon:yes gene_type:complete
MGLAKLFFKIFLVFGVITSCGPSDPNLFSLKNYGEGPDEFALVTLREIQMPESFSTLPVPTLGGSNLTDVNPQEDVILALGGSLSAKNGNKHKDDKLFEDTASRFGLNENIREELLSEDREFRLKNRGLLFERLASMNVYFKAYSSMTLDSEEELVRLNKLGVKILANPPVKAK